MILRSSFDQDDKCNDSTSASFFLDARKVLEKKIHAVDFKGLGKVDLIVKQHGEKVNTGIKRESRTHSPCLIKEKQEHCREASGKQVINIVYREVADLGIWNEKLNKKHCIKQ